MASTDSPGCVDRGRRGRRGRAGVASAGVLRPPRSAILRTGPRQRRGRPPLPDGDLVAAIGGISAGDVRDLMRMGTIQRFGQATKLAKPI
jgi:hypothetical protein